VRIRNVEEKIVEIRKNPQRASGRTRKTLNKVGPLFVLEKEERTSLGAVVRIHVRNLTTNWHGWFSTFEIVYEDYAGPLTEKDFK
jgi:hypothetical protein